MSIEAIGALSTGTSSAASRGLLFNEDEEQKKPKGPLGAYMGPPIGSLLNGSQKPDASAVRA